MISVNNVNSYIKNEGIVSWVTSSSTVGGLIYDINLGAWKQNIFSSNTGNVVQNNDGVIA